eukprot:TRINITY_DN21355_c0_g1_i4.p1 TRINITY_DN21355_c0_g1~~TRINITY_DN21355_c0_g1_i4.p1  ORF type:complete len:380 (-),score=49.07 TRINITY_DN21355_c0_g1_i4:315-1454(-)
MQLAVLGPLANATTPLLGTHYKGAACPLLDGQEDDSCVPTVYAELKAQAEPATVRFGGGCPAPTCVGHNCKLVPCTAQAIASAVAVVNKSTHVVLVLGITGTEHEGTNGDRTSIDLPADQRALTSAVLALNKPTVIVIVNGGAVALAEEKAAGAAIIEAYLPGKHGAGAIAKAVLGHTSPAGRLPYTVYPASWVNETSMTEMDPRVSPGRTYRFYTGTPIWEFGRGLTYTSFGLSKGKNWPVTPVIASSSTTSLAFEIVVQNTGARASDVVLTAYWSTVGDDQGMYNFSLTPVRKQLFEYERVHVAPGQVQTVAISVSTANLVITGANGDLMVKPATYRLSFDDGSGTNVVESLLEIVGEPVLVEAFPTMVAGAGETQR